LITSSNTATSRTWKTSAGAGKTAAHDALLLPRFMLQRNWDLFAARGARAVVADQLVARSTTRCNIATDSPRSARR